jgi:predicted heme/steroid binding protein
VVLGVPGRGPLRKELRRYDGKDGAPAFIAYEGRVYDVSRIFLWKNGRRQALHAAGRDVTGSLKEAPHPADLLRRFPTVGTLRED